MLTDDDDELDLKPIKEIKPKVINEYHSPTRKSEHEINFNYVKQNIPSRETTHKSSSQSVFLKNLNGKENVPDKYFKAKIPTVVWEDVQKSSKHVSQYHKELPVDVSPTYSSRQKPEAFKSSSNDNTELKYKREKTLDTSIGLPNELSNPIVNGIMREVIDEDTPSVHIQNNMSGITMRSESHQNSPSNEKKKEILPLEIVEESKDDEILLSKPEAGYKMTGENVMKRIHGGKLEPSNKDLIRGWKKMESLGAKYYGSKQPNKMMPGSPTGSKRKSPEDHQEILNEEIVTEDHETGSKRQKLIKEAENVCCHPMAGKGEEKSVKFRHYDPESIRKFMSEQKTKRNEEKQKQIKQTIDEKKRIETVLQGLQAHYKEKLPPPPLAAEKNKVDYRFFTHESDSESKDAESGTSPLFGGKHTPPPHCERVDAEVQCSERPPEAGRRTVDAATSYNAEELPSGNVRPQEKRTSRNHSKKGRGRCSSRSDDGESVSDIVSRALRECDERLNASMKASEEEAISDLSSAMEMRTTHPSRRERIASEEEAVSDLSSTMGMKTIHPSRRERIAALSEMAQRISKTIDKEEKSLDKAIHSWQKKSPTQREDNSHECSTSSSDDKNKHLPLNEIEALSVEQLVARMTAMLPKTSSKNVSFIKATDCKSKEGVKQAHSLNPCPQETQTDNFKSHNQQSNHFSKSQFHNLDVGSLKQSKETATDFKPISRVKQGTVPSLSAPQTPLLSFKNDMSQWRGYYDKPKFVPRIYSSLEVHAAIIIQACFRGFIVRKVTPPGLAERIRRKKIQKLAAAKAYPLVEPTLSIKVLNSRTLKENPNMKPSVDWYQLKTELNKKSQITLPPDSNAKKSTGLPKYVQPFYDLKETGDINAFIDTCPTSNLVTFHRHPSEPKQREPKSSTETNLVHNREAHLIKQPPHFDLIHRHPSEPNQREPKTETNLAHNREAHLIKHPPHFDLNHRYPAEPKQRELKTERILAHNRKAHLIKQPPHLDIVIQNKGTQTAHNSRHSDTKKAHGNADEIDLKTFQRRVDDVPRVRLKTPSHSESHELLFTHKNIEPTDYSIDSNDQLNSNLSSSYSIVHNTSSYYTVAKTPQTDGQSTFPQQDTLSEDLTSRSHEVSMNSASNELVSINKSTNVNNYSNERPGSHRAIHNSFQMSPSHLSLRVNAELAYQDTLGSALSHLQDLENLRALSQVQEKSAKVFTHFNHTLARNEAVDEELRQTRVENDALKQAKETAETQLKTRVDVDRLEREAFSRIQRLERDIRKRAEQVIDSATKPPYADYGAIASATAAAVGASIRALDHTYPNLNTKNEPEVSQHTSTTANTTTTAPSNTDASSLYSQSFVELSRETTFHSEINGSVGVGNQTHATIEEDLDNVAYTNDYSNDYSTSVSEESALNEVVRTSEVSPSETSRTVDEEIESVVGNSKTTTRTSGTVQEDIESPEAKSIKTTIDSATSTSTKTVSENTIAEENREMPSRSTNSLPEELISVGRQSLSSQREYGIKDLKNASIEEDLETNGHFSDTKSLSISERFSMKEKQSSTLHSSDEVTDNEILSMKLPSTGGSSGTIRTDIPKREDSDAISERLMIPSTAEESKTISVRTSISEMISSLAGPVNSNEKYSLSSQRSSSSNIHETLKSVSVSHTADSVVQSKATRAVGDTSGTYSESFEPDSGTSDTSESSLVRSKVQKTIIEIDTVTHQNSSSSETARKGDGLDMPSSAAHSQAGTPRSNRGGALFSTLSLLESLQKEEEIRLQHQMAVFKLHEQSLVEEARVKLASLYSEGGTNVRKKQRAILLQLREQRAHIRRLIETQNLAAQQKHLIFWQHHQLLSSTTNPLSLSTNRILPSRVQSPITTRILDLSLSSSDGLENVTNSSFKPLTKPSETFSGEETRMNKQTESVDENSEGRSSDGASAYPRDRPTKKEEKIKKHKERLAKITTPTAKLTKISPKATPDTVSDEEKEVKKISPSENDTSGSSEGKSEEMVQSVNSSINSEKGVSKNDSLSESITVEEEQSMGEALGSDSKYSSPQPSQEVDQSAQTDHQKPSEEAISTVKSDTKSDVESARTETKNEKKTTKDVAGFSGSSVPITIRFPLSPRSRLRHRRQSSESDDSFTLSQNETASDMSDGEGKLVALREELAVRKAEAEKLKKEKRKILRERISSQELALKKQIAVYESYIKQTKSDIEREARELQNTAAVKPLIKKPKVAGRRKLQLHDHTPSHESSDILEESSVNESFVTDSSSVHDASIKGSGNVSFSTSSEVREEESRKSSHESISDEKESSRANNTESVIEESHVDAHSHTEIDTPDLKEETTGSFAEYSVSGRSKNDADDSEGSASQNSSTETILHSPKKSASLTGSDLLNLNEAPFAAPIESGANDDFEPISYEHSFTESATTTSKEDRDVGKTSTETENEKTPVISEKEDKKSAKTPVISEKEDKNSAKTPVISEKEDKKSAKTPVISEKEDKKSAKTPVLSEKQDKKSAETENKQVSEKKLDIFIPGDEGVEVESSKDTDNDETIAEDICEEIPIDESDSESTHLGIEKDTVFTAPSEAQTKEERKDREIKKLKRKADSVADSILESLVSESVTCIRGLLSDREKEIREIVGHIEESGEADLKSGNLPSARFELGLEKGKVKATPIIPLVSESIFEEKERDRLFPFSVDALRQDTLISLAKEKEPAEKPLESTEATLDSSLSGGKDCRINSPLDIDAEIRSGGVKAEELASRLLNVQTTTSAVTSAFDDVADLNETFAVSSCEGKWLEGDFWKAGEKVKSEKELRDEEELLNAEIARLEEIQRFKERYPNLVIREVPDKPPPPYTPPKDAAKKGSFSVETVIDRKVDTPRIRGGFPEPQTPSNTISVPHRLSKADLRKFASDMINVIPSKHEDVLASVESFFDLLYTQWMNGTDPSSFEHPTLAQQTKKEEKDALDDDDDSLDLSESTFQRLLFHLTRELVARVYTLHNTAPRPVWFPSTFPHPAKPWQVVRRLTKENVLAYVVKRVRVFMGWDSPTARETTMMKWARKKKERVDQVLVHELQSEEANWTQYDEEEVEVKFKLSRELLRNLVEETVSLFQPIVQRKLAYKTNGNLISV